MPGYAAALGADAGGAVDEDLPDLHDLLHLGPCLSRSALMLSEPHVAKSVQVTAELVLDRVDLLSAQNQADGGTAKIEINPT